MASTLEIVKSEIGRLLGLDGANDANKEYTPYLTGDGLRGMRFYPTNKAFLLGNDYKISAPFLHNDVFDDFLGKSYNDILWNANKGSDGTAASALNVADNGTFRLTTGAGATHTMAVNGAQIAGALNFLVSDSGLRMEARLGAISALTSQSICFGLVDATTLSAPFTRTTATTTANGTNGAAFLLDAASTNAHLYAVAVNAGGTPQNVALNVDVDVAAFHIYRIEIDALGNALFFIDGKQVASILLAVAATAVLAPSVGMFSEATAGSQTLDIDYLLLQKLRV
jgi:hypothetical protein